MQIFLWSILFSFCMPASQLATTAEFCIYFLEDTLQSQAEECGVTECWVDHVYNFRDKTLRIHAIVGCDGARDVYIYHNEDLVFASLCYDDEERKIHVYTQGTWEAHLEALLCDYQKHLTNESTPL